MQEDAFLKGSNVVIVDDLLGILFLLYKLIEATGGSALAAQE